MWKKKIEKSEHVIQYDLQGFIAKNVPSDSKKATHLSHILKKWVRWANNSKCLTLQETFEIRPADVRKAKIYGIPFCILQRIKLLLDTFSSFFFEHKKSVEKRSIKRKIGVTKHPRSLNLGKVIALAICSIIVHLLLSARA